MKLSLYLLLGTVVSSVKADFDIKNANETLHYAWAAYCDDSSLKNWDCPWCVGPNAGPKLELQTYLSDWMAGTQGYVGLDVKGKRIITAYRGSKNFPNVVQDAEFWLTSMAFGPPELKVDYGFQNAYLTFQNKTKEAIRGGLEECPDCSLLFTGHSLGASMATLAAVDASIDFPDTAVNLYTFGSPRVGNKEFVKYATAQLSNKGSSVVRMRRQTDIVPSIPPRVIGYEHLATEVWDKHTDDGKPDTYVVCDGSGEDPQCGDSDEEPFFPLYLLKLSPAQHTQYMSFKGGNC